MENEVTNVKHVVNNFKFDSGLPQNYYKKGNLFITECQFGRKKANRIFREI